MGRVQEMMDVMYRCEDIRDHINELREVLNLRLRTIARPHEPRGPRAQLAELVDVVPDILAAVHHVHHLLDTAHRSLHLCIAEVGLATTHHLLELRLVEWPVVDQDRVVTPVRAHYLRLKILQTVLRLRPRELLHSHVSPASTKSK